VRASDPGLFALKSAVRAAIVMPLAFALSLEVFEQKQMALFASFGSMALLVFVEFGGARGARLRAYLALVAVGCVLITLGTLCSHSAWLATVAMALVAFTILFAGAVGEYFAAASAGAMLTYVLAVMVPADTSEIPTRLAGWALAGALSVSAALLLWPERPRAPLREQAAELMSVLGALVRARSDEDAAAEPLVEQAHAGVRALRERFVSTPHRPSGTARSTAALGRLVGDLGWLRPIAARAPRPLGPNPPFAAECAAIEAAAPAALESVAARLRIGELTAREMHRCAASRAARDALERLRRAHEALGHALVEHFAGAWHRIDETRATLELDEAYRLRQLSFGAMQTGRDALLACGEQIDGDPLQSRRARLDASGRLALTHASMRSVWLRNSVRGALGLGLAVLVGQLSDLQHAFWIVLGTMAVLRSSALATGTTIAWALLGTLAGIVGGGLLVAAVGSHEAVLWAVLPFAALLAAYAPRAISFAAGQAAFSMVVLVLFNLIEPVGWTVGLVRVEDVAIGAGVSLLAGVLIWPRGATAVLREALGSAYSRAAGYLDRTVDALLGRAAPESVAPAAREALASAQLLESTIRDYLSERSSARAGLEQLSMLVAGASRTRRVARLLEGAQSFARLAPIADHLPRLARARDAFEAERRARCDWYASLGTALATASSPPAPEPLDHCGADEPPGQVVLESPPGDSGVPPGLAIAWAHRHLQALAEIEPMLAYAGAHLGSGFAGDPSMDGAEPAAQHSGQLATH
jgi:uncharacterized membrane protein YccC